MLIFSPIVLLLSLHMMIVYGYLYLIFTAIPTLFKEKYHFSTGNTGLAYIGVGLGASAGLIITGTMSDRVVTRLAAKNGGERKPEYRIPIIMGAALSLPIGLFWFGWTGQTHQHWILPMIGLFFIGLGMTPVIVSILFHFLGRVIETNYSDVGDYILGGRLHHIRCICSVCQHCSSFSWWCISSSGWQANV